MSIEEIRLFGAVIAALIALLIGGGMWYVFSHRTSGAAHNAEVFQTQTIRQKLY